MGAPSLFKLLARLAALLVVVCAMPAAAQVHDTQSIAPNCHFASDQELDFDEVEDAAAWICDGTGWRADQAVVWLKFDSDTWSDVARPGFFYTRIARFESISFAAIDDDGATRKQDYSESDGLPFASGPMFELPLPEIRAETRFVIARIEHPHSVPMLTEARLSAVSKPVNWTQKEVMLLALVIGMLVLPFFFDISFFLVLRERFVLLHAIMVITMMGYVAVAGGLITVFFTLPLPVLAVAAPLTWAIGTGCAALFLADFLEPGAQSKLMRRLMWITGIWTILVPGFFSFQLHVTHPIDDRGYFLAFVPVLFLITAAIVEAVLRGSRSARFVAIAWFPIILASADRLLRGLGAYVGPSNMDQALYIATGMEVIMISLAIADRFLALRRERDEAVTEARMLERISERDPLTGLMNRRAIEDRFGELRKDGFDTFALIDLDRFKDINDRFGHQVGDAALVACADAICGDEDRNSIAVRLGGEEFVVLLRGAGAVKRAEALRQAIPLRIAHHVEGLDRPVTASMGVIELPRVAATTMKFKDFYARADTLLYEAKESGRNRMLYERLTLFDGNQATRSAAAAA